MKNKNKRIRELNWVKIYKQNKKKKKKDRDGIRMGRNNKSKNFICYIENARKTKKKKMSNLAEYYFGVG